MKGFSSPAVRTSGAAGTIRTGSAAEMFLLLDMPAQHEHISLIPEFLQINYTYKNKKINYPEIYFVVSRVVFLPLCEFYCE